jgi:hypothetical protein
MKYSNVESIDFSFRIVFMVTRSILGPTSTEATGPNEGLIFVEAVEVEAGVDAGALEGDAF